MSEVERLDDLLRWLEDWCERHCLDRERETHETPCLVARELLGNLGDFAFVGREQAGGRSSEDTSSGAVAHPEAGPALVSCVPTCPVREAAQQVLNWLHNPVQYQQELERALAARCVGPPAAPSEAVPDERPIIVCLCGSTRFKEAFDEANYQETMAGRIVLSVGFFMHATGNRHGEGVGATPEQKIALDALHLRKIELADEVLVLNVGDYIGDSTGREIAYAHSLGKPVRYLEPVEAERGAPPPDTA